MKTNLHKSAAVLAAVLAVASTSIHAQPTRASMEAIKMPAPHYNKTDNLDYPGDWGYWTVGSLRSLDHQTPTPNNPRNWNWVRYTNTGNAKQVWFMASLAYSACSHAHISYGLWGKYSYSVAGFKTSGWIRIGMGTQSGEVINGSCKWDVNNVWSQFGEDFGWGTNFITGDYRNTPFKFTEYVAGIIGLSHGGDCGTPQCAYPVTSYLWTLP